MEFCEAIDGRRTDVKLVEAKSIFSKSNLPVCDYSANPYVGCSHACRYCYASFMKRFSGHEEPWGDFVDVKMWKPLKNVEKYDGALLGSASGQAFRYPASAISNRLRTSSYRTICCRSAVCSM